MPMTVSNKSMFQPSTYDPKDFEVQCMDKYGVRPRPHWITTEFGGYVSDLFLFPDIAYVSSNFLVVPHHAYIFHVQRITKTRCNKMIIHMKTSPIVDEYV